MNWFMNNYVSALCVVCAFSLALAGVEGWGWFLFVGALTYGGGLIVDGEED